MHAVVPRVLYGVMTDHVARAKAQIEASPQSVWDALTDPEQIATWMMGSQVTTDWAVGSDIRWKGEMNGETYEDKGEILVYDEPTRLSMTHYSPLMGEPDEPESYHTVTYEITPTVTGRSWSSARTATTRPSRRSSSVTTGSRCSTASSRPSKAADRDR